MVEIDEILRLIERLAPLPICDECISGRLGILARQNARGKILELAGKPGFERGRSTCTLCGSETMVIRRL